MWESSLRTYGAILLALVLLVHANDCLHVNGQGSSDNQTDVQGKTTVSDLSPQSSSCRLQGAVDDCCEYMYKQSPVVLSSAAHHQVSRSNQYRYISGNAVFLISCL